LKSFEAKTHFSGPKDLRFSNLYGKTLILRLIYFTII
jgi:hypothetical protein